MTTNTVGPRFDTILEQTSQRPFLGKNCGQCTPRLLRRPNIGTRNEDLHL